MEDWKVIYGHYAVSTNGRVRNLNTGKLLKPQSRGKRGGGYAFINIYSNGKRLNWNIHALVADAFIEYNFPGSGKVVHHKDHNRMNPKLENLEYLTIAENNNHRKE